MFDQIFPSLEGFEPTRDTLHAYAKAVGVIPRTYAAFHPRWWHIALAVKPDGLYTTHMPLPGEGFFFLRIDLLEHQVTLETNRGRQGEISMREGLTATELGERLLGDLARLGLEAGQVRGERGRFANDDPRPYDPEMAGRFFTALRGADRVFKRHRATLGGEAGPVQLWPHGFDLAFEWFGSRQVPSQAGENVKHMPAQLNLGFSPGEPGHPEPYFYSNPWPFDKAHLLDGPLPRGARWFTGRWEGSLLPYAELAGDPQAEERLLAYARAVYEISRPTLMAEWQG